MTTELLGLDTESLDRYINEVMLGGKQVVLSMAKRSGKTTLSIIWFFKLVERLKERNIWIETYQSKSFPNYFCDAIEYTGEGYQQEFIKSWLKDRHVYYCADVSGKEYFFSPGLPAAISAKPGDMIYLGRNFKDLGSCPKDQFLQKYELTYNVTPLGEPTHPKLIEPKKISTRKHMELLETNEVDPNQFYEVMDNYKDEEENTNE